jgi:dTDP-glucose 4,6-dehydratase
VVKPALLITGGAGFIGSEFVRQAVGSNRYSKIFVLDSLTYAADTRRISEELENSTVEFIHSDVNQTAKYNSVLSNVQSVVHFAAESHVDRSNANGMPFLESNILGTYALLEAARSHSEIRTVLVSTDEVYGSIEQGEFSEGSQLNPSSAYSVSKASSDLFGLAMNHTFKQDIVITRGCNTYGPFQHQEKLIPLCISKLLDGAKAPLYGDGTNIREWIYVSDHANAISEVLHKGKSGQIYNIGSGVRFSNRQIIDQLLTLLKLDWDWVEFIQDRPGHDYRYAINSQRVGTEIGWKPLVSFAEGIERTLNWYRGVVAK